MSKRSSLALQLLNVSGVLVDTPGSRHLKRFSAHFKRKWKVENNLQDLQLPCFSSHGGQNSLQHFQKGQLEELLTRAFFNKTTSFPLFFLSIFTS